MTDDEKAEAVLEALVGIQHCPVCGMPMEELPKRRPPFQFVVCDDLECLYFKATGSFLFLGYD